MKRREISVLAMSMLFALVFAGCNTTLGLNTEALEQAIRTGIEDQNTELTVTEIGCPDRPIQQGDVFTCTATTSTGQTLTVTVTQTDATGNVDWRVTATN